MITNSKEDIKQIKQNKNASNLLRLIQLSERDIRKGKYRSASEVFSDLRRKLDIWKMSTKKQ